MGETAVADGAVELCRKYAKEIPLQVLEADGHYVTMFHSERGLVLHFLAADYDVGIDYHLDEIRFHRSRVNYVNKADPVGVSRRLRIAAQNSPEVYLSFHDEVVTPELWDGVCSIELPEGCSHLLVRFPTE